MESARTVVYRTVAYWIENVPARLDDRASPHTLLLASRLQIFSYPVGYGAADKIIIWSDTITLPTPDALPLCLYIVVYYGKWHSTIICKI